MSFQIIPAIDLMRGKCVRLYKGSYEQKTEYSVTPQNQAEIFEQEGADVLHIVDLDGAKVGRPINISVVKKIRERISIPIEVGGGIRSVETAEKFFAVGANRVILGTAAVENPKLLEKLLIKFGPEKIIVGLDARKKGTRIATRGWKSQTEIDTLDFAEKLEKMGITRIIFTDISRDGTLTFPNFDINERLIKITNLHIIASGGIAEIEHLKILRRIGCEGAILGKALYEHKLSIEEIKKSLEE